MKKGFDRESFMAVRKLTATLFSILGEKFRDRVIGGELTMVKIHLFDEKPDYEIEVNNKGIRRSVLIPDTDVIDELVSLVEIPSTCKEVEILFDRTILYPYDVLKLFSLDDVCIVSHDSEEDYKTLVVLLDCCRNVVVRNIKPESKKLYKMIKRFSEDLLLRNAEDIFKYIKEKNIYIVSLRRGKIIVDRSFVCDACKNVVFFNNVRSFDDVAHTKLDVYSYYRYYKKSKRLGLWNVCWLEDKNWLKEDRRVV